MKNLAIIGTAGIPANYGGFETLVHHLVPRLTKQYNTTVYCSGKNYAKKKRLKTYKGAKLVYLPMSANGITSVVYDILSMIHALFSHKSYLVLGVSGALFFPILRMFNKDITVNVDGIEWKRQKWNKLAKFFLKLSEKIAVRFAQKVICDNQSVLNYIEEEYNIKGVLIPYGGDHVLKVKQTKEIVQQYPFLKKPYAFKVARIEPENNIHMILEAFTSLNLQLVVIGNWAKSEYGLALQKKYKSQDHIHLIDPIYDNAILDQIRGNAMIYIHGHAAGGTNPSLVEAMNLRLPIFSYDVSFNRETTKDKATYFLSAFDLISKIKGVSYAELNDNKYQMFQIAKQHYTWNTIAESYVNLFKNTSEIEKLIFSKN